MNFNRVKNMAITILLITIVLLCIGQSAIYAATGSLSAALDTYRYLPEFNASTNQYTYNSTGWGFKIGASGKAIYQINELDSSSNITGANSRLYCLNARVGDVWNNNAVGQKVDYTNNFDWRNDKTTILGGNTENVLTSNYYSAITWLLDNFYIPNVTDKEDFLKNIGIVKDDEFYIESHSGEKFYPYHYAENKYNFATNNFTEFGYAYLDSNGSIKDAILPDYMIETVQQAAIWHFTNYLDGQKENIFNCYTNQSTTPNWLYYTTDGNNYTLLGDYDKEHDIGEMYQEQAAILYNYLVDKASEANTAGYTGIENVATIDIDISDKKIEQSDENYKKIGPLKIVTTGIVSDIAVTVNIGTVKSSIIAEEEFYITNIPIDFDGDVVINVTAKGNTTTQTLWKENGSTHQPIIELNREKMDLSDSESFSGMTGSVDFYFDLALRKEIVGVKNGSGVNVSILNEQGLDATRTITADVSTIPNTATYKHRKDPVVVRPDYVITYRLNIYNEGKLRRICFKNNRSITFRT